MSSRRAARASRLHNSQFTIDNLQFTFGDINVRMHALTRRDLGRLALAGLAPLAVQPAPTRRYGYLHLDVFTERPFEGNQLLTFLQPQRLEADAMQRITRESNYSECTFVFRR